MTNYSEETRKKANSFANAIETDTVKVGIAITKAEYISSENLIILNGLLSDFAKEKGINTQFQKWLKNKALSQKPLF
jgi:hypothetical protein